jgi:hypothetical protein
LVPAKSQAKTVMSCAARVKVSAACCKSNEIAELGA